MRYPEGPLGKAGPQLWRGVTAAYELSPAELVTLDCACRTADLLARLDVELSADVTAEGSMGQVRAHPLLRSLVELDARQRKPGDHLRPSSSSLPSSSESSRDSMRLT